MIFFRENKRKKWFYQVNFKVSQRKSELYTPFWRINCIDEEYETNDWNYAKILRTNWIILSCHLANFIVMSLHLELNFEKKSWNYVTRCCFLKNNFLVNLTHIKNWFSRFFKYFVKLICFNLLLCFHDFFSQIQIEWTLFYTIVLLTLLVKEWVCWPFIFFCTRQKAFCIRI